MTGVPSFPAAEMSAAFERLRRQSLPIRRAVLRVAAPAIVSEAQVESPVKTGFLQNSHTALFPTPDLAELGANAAYAAVVHAVHPSKAQWFTRAMFGHGPRILAKALEQALADAADAARGPN